MEHTSVRNLAKSSEMKADVSECKPRGATDRQPSQRLPVILTTQFSCAQGSEPTVLPNIFNEAMLN